MDAGRRDGVSTDEIRESLRFAICPRVVKSTLAPDAMATKGPALSRPALTLGVAQESNPAIDSAPAGSKMARVSSKHCAMAEQIASLETVMMVVDGSEGVEAEVQAAVFDGLKLVAAHC